MTTATTAAPAYIASHGSIKVEPLTCTIGAELANVNLGARRRDPRAAPQAPRALLPRPGRHARGARRVRAALRRARGSPGRRQRSRQPGPGAHLQVARHAERPLRELLAHGCDLA